MERNDQLTVLVIDDEPQMCALIARLLLRDGHQVVSAGSAEEGLEQLPYFRFDVAFLDQNLPGMDGLVFGEYLRSNNPHMQIALVTADTDVRLVRHGSRHDISVIHKPFTSAQILDVVSACRARLVALREEGDLRQAADYGLALGQWKERLAEAAALPALSKRQTERLEQEIKRRLHRLKSASRYEEEDRAVAYGCLVAAALMGAQFSAGAAYYEEYDALMLQHGKEVVFSRADGSEDGL